MGGSIYLEENPNLVIGWWQQTPPTDIVLPGQTKELVGPALVRDEFVENLRGEGSYCENGVRNPDSAKRIFHSNRHKVPFISYPRKPRY